MPRKPLTEAEIEMAICYSVMTTWNFSYTKRLEWEVWAAAHRPCPTCHEPAKAWCLNMGDLHYNLNHPGADRPVRPNKRPHDRRIDWTRLLNGLKERGYYRPAIEAQVRKQVR